MFALPSEWGTRNLPKPSVVYAFAAILDKEEFQKLCHSERRRMGVGGVTSALGDGAPWGWNVTQNGLIEGACKNLIGKRLKQTGAYTLTGMLEIPVRNLKMLIL